MIDYKDLAKEWPKGDLEKLSHAVAEVYTNALNGGAAPRQSVAIAFKKHEQTAARMIKKARELGILKEDGKGRGGRPRNADKSDWELIALHETEEQYTAEFCSDGHPGLYATLHSAKSADKHIKITGFEITTVGDEATITAAGIREIPYGLLSYITKKEIQEVRND